MPHVADTYHCFTNQKINYQKRTLTTLAKAEHAITNYKQPIDIATNVNMLYLKVVVDTVNLSDSRNSLPRNLCANLYIRKMMENNISTSI